jgi:hypothetical protein
MDDVSIIFKKIFLKAPSVSAERVKPVVASHFLKIREE